jgi:CheY-like chemotaxis protein
MRDLLMDVEFWKAVLGLGWPVAAVGIVWMLRDEVRHLLRRESVMLKVGSLEISVSDAAQQAGKAVTDLQARVARLEGAGAAVPVPAGASAPAPDTGGRAARDAGQRGGQDAGREAGRDAGRDAGAAGATEGMARRAPFSILWVDDRPQNNAFLIDRFQSEGIRIRPAATTAEALAALATDRFDLVVSDLERVENGVVRSAAGLELLEARPGDAPPVAIFAGAGAIAEAGRLKAAGARWVTASGVDLIHAVQELRGS